MVLEIVLLAFTFVRCFRLFQQRFTVEGDADSCVRITSVGAKDGLRPRCISYLQVKQVLVQRTVGKDWNVALGGFVAPAIRRIQIG